MCLVQSGAVVSMFLVWFGATVSTFWWALAPVHCNHSDVFARSGPLCVIWKLWKWWGTSSLIWLQKISPELQEISLVLDLQTSDCKGSKPRDIYQFLVTCSSERIQISKHCSVLSCPSVLRWKTSKHCAVLKTLKMMGDLFADMASKNQLRASKNKPRARFDVFRNSSVQNLETYFIFTTHVHATLSKTRNIVRF